jgi:uncharacterized membrane protein YdjX (TVP38/TMEM64 family)
MTIRRLQKYKKALVFLCLLGLILTFNAIFGWSDMFSDPKKLPLIQKNLEENLPIAILLYICVTVLGCVVLALPGVIFALAAGFLFGPFFGTMACSVAATIGAAIAFLAGRYFLRDTIQPIVMRNRYIKKIFLAAGGHNDIFLLMVTRLVPLFPYNLQNFAYGITNMKFWSYTLYSLLFMLPGTAAYTLIAAGISDSTSRVMYLCSAIALLVLVTTISFVLKKKSGLINETEKGD